MLNDSQGGEGERLIEQDRYVPVFDPEFDTFESVRARSGMLFDTICTIGCRAEHGLSLFLFQRSRRVILT